jgi:hypothetical protein
MTELAVDGSLTPLGFAANVKEREKAKLTGE